jgi:hypothetical protein
MLTHAKAIDGYGEAQWLGADDLVLIEDEAK